jgi:hypothetical protein
MLNCLSEPQNPKTPDNSYEFEINEWKPGEHMFSESDLLWTQT